MNARKAVSVAALVIVAGLVSPALAEDPPPGPWGGSGELSFVSTSGNTETETLGLALGLSYMPGLWTGEFKIGFLRAETDGELTAEKLTGLVGLRRSISERFDAYSRLAYLKNEFADVGSSWSLEAGGLYKALTGEVHFLDLSVGLGYTTEDRLSEADRDFAMATLGAAYKWRMTATTDLTNDFGFVHDFEDSGNWRLANATGIAAAINSIFSLKASYALAYQNEPSLGFEKRDTVTAVAFVAKF